MKKIIMLAVALCLCFPCSIHAEDSPVDSLEGNTSEVENPDDIYSPQSQEIALVAVVGSSYSVFLPKNGDEITSDATYEIAVLDAGEGELDIKIYKDGKEIQTENEGSEKVNLVIKNEKSDFTHADLEDEYVTDGNGSTTVTISHEALSGGVWSGKLPITISLSKK